MNKRELYIRSLTIKKLMRSHSISLELSAEILKFINHLYIYINEGFEEMDKKMHQVTKRMKTAEKEIKDNKDKLATKTLKKAEVKNEKLVKIDKTVRDPIMKEVKKVSKMDKKVK